MPVSPEQTRILSYLILLIVFSGLYSAFQPATAREPVDCENIKAATEVQPGLFVRPGRPGIMFEDDGLANIGFIIGEKEIAVIDSGGSIQQAQKLICQIRKASHLPIRYVINTHVHPDHTLGNSAFDDAGITFIGHANLEHAMAVLSKTYLRRYNEITGENLSDKHIVFPQIKVRDELDLDLGNRRLTLIAAAKAHTNNDLLVHDRKTGTLWLSDLLFHEHVPVIGKSGSVSGWLKVMQNLQQQNIKHVIPGHGPLNLSWNDAVRKQSHYLQQLRHDIRSYIRDDADLTQAMETIGLDETAKWLMFSTYHKRNISYIYSELEWE